MASDAPSTTSPPPLAGPTQATTTEQSSGHLISSPARSLSRIWERIAGPGSPQPRVATDALDRALSTDASDDSLTNDEDESADDDTTSLSGIEVGRSRRLVDTGALPIDVLGRFGPGASPPSSAQRTSASWDRFRPTRWGMSNRNSNREDLDDPQLSFFVHSNLAQALNTAGPASRFHGTNEDCALPLDNEEGVVVDDEACFVDGWEGRVDFLSSLPHEISLYILLHLDFRSLLVASSVSRQWHGLAGDNILWRDLFHREQRWTIREPAEDDSRADFFDSVPFSSPASPLKRVASSLGRPAVKRPILTREPSSSGARLGRRLSDMLPDLGSLSLTRTTSTASATAVSAPIADGGSPAPTPVTPRRPSAATISRASAANATFTIGTLASAVSPTSPFTLSRNNSSSALASLASSISSLPPSRGPSRRASSATLPPLGPVPSPSLHMTPSAPLFLDWPRLYRDRFTLDQRWSKGRPRSTWLKGHTDSVYCLQFDAHKVISGSRDQTIRVWDIATGRTTKILTGHEGSVLCLQFDEQVLISGSSDSRILVWDLVGEAGTGKGQWEVKQSLIGHAMGVLDLCFDDQWIVSCSKDTTIRIWHRQTGELYRTLAGHRGPVNAVQLRDNKVVSASGDSLMKLWDVLTGEVIRIFTGHDRGLACVQYSPSGKLLASGSNDKCVKIWNAETGECLTTLAGHTDLVRSLAFDEVSRRVVSGSYDRTTRVWDLDSGKELHKFKGHSSLVFDVSFSATRILSSSHDQRVLIHDFGDGLETSLFL